MLKLHFKIRNNLNIIGIILTFKEYFFFQNWKKFCYEWHVLLYKVEYSSLLMYLRIWRVQEHFSFRTFYFYFLLKRFYSFSSERHFLWRVPLTWHVTGGGRSIVKFRDSFLFESILKQAGYHFISFHYLTFKCWHRGTDYEKANIHAILNFIKYYMKVK